MTAHSEGCFMVTPCRRCPAKAGEQCEEWCQKHEDMRNTVEYEDGHVCTCPTATDDDQQEADR